MSELINTSSASRMSVISTLQSVTKHVQLMVDKNHQRKQLAQLSIEQLNDMGIDPVAAQKEINKPFWK